MHETTKETCIRPQETDPRKKKRWTTEGTCSAVRDHMRNIFSWATFICSSVHACRRSSLCHSAGDDEPVTAAGTGGAIHGCGPLRK
jgi:hypothetical protein